MPKHIAPQFELPGVETAFNLAGETIRRPEEKPAIKTWDDVENARDLFTGPQREISKTLGQTAQG